MFRQIVFSGARATVHRRQFLIPRANYSIVESAKDALKKVNKKIGEVAAEGLEKVEQATPSAEEVKEKASKLADKVPDAAEVKKKASDLADKVPDKSQVKKGIRKTQKKAANAIEEGADAVEEKSPDYEDIKKAGKDAHAKAKSTLQEGKEKILESSVGDSVIGSAKKLAETVSDTAASLNKKAGQAAAAGLDKIQEAVPSTEEIPSKHSAAKLKNEAHNKEVDRVNENAKDYRDLRDKGSKVESEQNRPDDAV